MSIGLLKKLRPRREREKKLYFLGKDKTLHFYADCSSISGKVKAISCMEAIKYSLCSVCSERLDSEIHKTAADLAAHLDSYIEELVTNVAESALSKDDKASVLRAGIVAIAVTTLAYQLFDNIGKGGDK